jgi:hypothetical protein
VDANQQAIVEALEKFGCSVERLSKVGRGVPDLLVGTCGINVLLEVKDLTRKGGKENSTGTLAKQRKWRVLWRGSVHVVSSPEEAIAAVRRAHAIISPQQEPPAA